MLLPRKGILMKVRQHKDTMWWHTVKNTHIRIRMKEGAVMSQGKKWRIYEDLWVEQIGVDWVEK